MAMELDATGQGPAGGVRADDQQVTLVAETTPGTPAGAPPKTTTIALDAGAATVHLPEGVDTSHPVQVGNDLEFIQPDGSIILIPNGAVAGLVIFVGNVELNADAVAALFSANNITPAEGPQGATGGAHGNYDDPGPQGIGESFGLTNLLLGNELGSGGPGINDLEPQNTAPVFLNGPISAVVAEEAFPVIGNEDTDGNTDTLGATTVYSGNMGGFDADGNPLLYSLTPPPAGALSSDGYPVDNWVGSGTNDLTGYNTFGDKVLNIHIDNATGNFTVTLFQAVDQPNDATTATNEDAISIVFGATVQDVPAGATAHTTFTLTIEDDSAIILPSDPTAGGQNLISNGQFLQGPDGWGFDPNGASSIPGWTISGAHLELNPPNWYVPDPADGGHVVDLDASPGDVTLSQDLTTLTAGVQYTLSFDAARPGNFDATVKVYWNGTLIDTVTPDNAAFHKYTYELVAGTGTNTITFQEVGAADKGGTFLANVSLISSGAFAVDEDELAGGNPGGDGDIVGATNVATGSLNILWGADNFNNDVDGGIGAGGPVNGDRAVTFADNVVGALEAQYLRSHGIDLDYVVSANGTLLTAYRTDGVSYYDADGHVTSQANASVFTVALSDQHSGSFTFTLTGTIDHPVTSTEDNVNLNIGFVATDSDKDPTSGSFTIAINDDMPAATGDVVTGTADEDDLADYAPVPLYPLVEDFWQGSLGTSPYDGTGPDQSHTGLLGTVPVWGNLSGLATPGADGPGHWGIASVADAEVWLHTAGANGGVLKSHGDEINDARDITIPGVGDAMGFFASDGRLVFGLFVGEDGVYNFRLFDQLDHPQGDNAATPAPEAIQDILTLDFSKVVTYSDFDGDTINFKSGTITINVVDDVPVLTGASVSATLDEDDLRDFIPTNALLLQLSPDEFKDLPSILSIVGSTGTDGNPSGLLDNLLGTTSKSGFLNEIIGTHVVNGGADETGKFGLLSDHDANLLVGGLNLSSGGSAVDHVESINLPVIGTVMGFFAHDGHLVFTLTVGALGNYDIRLVDQLDHPQGDNPQTAQPEAIQDTLTFDLGKFVTYTDYDGDKIDLGGHITLNVVDDIPVASGSLAVTLDEDDLNDFNATNAGILHFTPSLFQALPSLLSVVGSAGTDGNPTGLLDSVLGTTSQSGLLNNIVGNNVVSIGADEFGKFGLLTDTQANALVGNLQLTSEHSAIDHIETVNLGSLGNVMGFFSHDGRLIFTLTVGELGNYDIRLVDQIDHPQGDDPNTAQFEAIQDTLSINLGQFVTYTDRDGDKIDLSGHVTLTVVDDVPETVPGAQAIGVVEEEDGISTLFANDMGHGNQDIDDDAGGLDNDPTPSSLTGISNATTFNLTNIVKVGADDQGIFTFSTGIVGQAVTDTDGNLVYSHGSLVSFALQGGNIIGKAADGRVVFSLQFVDDNILDPASYADGFKNGKLTFNLLDQLDHADTTQLHAASENLLTLDLSPALKFSDADGDTIALDSDSVIVKIVDDVPVQTSGTRTAVVEEEQVSSVSPGDMGHGNDDKNAGSGDADTDTNGNLNRTTNIATGSLQDLFSVGQDEVSQKQIHIGPVTITGASYGTFSFGSTEGLPSALYSKGELVTYALSDSNNDGLMDTLTASANGRPVFTLTIVSNGENSGSYTFTLLDQIDHAAGQGENVYAIDLSSVVQFSDYDKDTITARDGTLTVKIIDDVPVTKGDVTAGTTLDDEAQTLFTPVNTGGASGDASPDVKTVSGGAGALFSVGADDRGSIAVTGPALNIVYKDANGFAQTEAVTWTSSTDPATGTVTLTAAGAHNASAAVLTINIDGSYTFTMNAPVAHQTPGTSEEDASLKFNFTVTDFDQDSANGSLTIKVDDDTPIRTAVIVTASTLDDEAQSLFPGNAGGTSGDVSPDAKTATGAAGALFSAGADGVKSVAMTSADVAVIYKDGTGHGVSETASWSNPVVGAGGATTWTLTSTHYGSDSPAATLVVYADGSYSLTVNAPIAHPTSGGAEETKDLSFAITVTDGDGDTAATTLKVGINDDTPTLTVNTVEGGYGNLSIELDETVGADRYSAGESEDAGGNANTDDASGVLARVTTNIAGGLASFFSAPISYGADGPGTFSGTFAFVNVPTNGIATNLSATHGGAIVLKLVGGDLVGYDNNGAGDAVFTIKIVQPTLAIYQLETTLNEAISHTDANLFDGEQLLKTLSEGSVGLQYTVAITDGDGDPISQSAILPLITSNGSPISFDDDGPKLTVTGVGGFSNGLFLDGFVPNGDTWGQGSGTNGTGTAGAWSIQPSTVEPAGSVQLERVGDGYRGADSPSNSTMVDLEASPGNVQVSQTLHGLTAGEQYHITFEIGAGTPNPGDLANTAILQVLWNNVAVGVYNPATGVMQVEAVDVIAVAGDNVLTFREIGDAGDSTGTFLANVRVTDVISIDETAGLQGDEVADLSTLFTAIGTKGVDPNMAAQYAQGAHAILTATPDYGSDDAAAVNPLVYSFTLPVSGENSGLTTTEGNQIALTVESGVVVGRVVGGAHNGEAAFALAINPTTGVVSVAQYLSLHHPDSGSSDEAIYLGANTVAVTVTATDGDGDHISQTTDVSGLVGFHDDGPQMLAGNRDWTLDEDMLAPAGNDSHDSPADPNDYTSLPNKDLGVAWGADGPGTLSFAATDAAHPIIGVRDLNGNAIAAPLTSHGVAVTYDIVTNADGGQTLTAKAGATTIFTLTLDPDAGANGTFSFNLLGHLDHPAGLGENRIDLSFGFTARDGDLDPVDSSVIIRITDDVPYIGAATAGAVDEEGLVTGTNNGDGDLPGTATSFHGNLAVSFGADGPATAVVSAPVSVLNFNNFLNGAHGPFDVGTYHLTTNEGISNWLGTDAQIFGSTITVTNSGGPFTVNSFNVGLNGTSDINGGDVYITGIDTLGHTIVVTKHITGLVTLGPSLSQSISLVGTALDGVLLTSLNISPEHDSHFNGRVIVDNLSLGGTPSVTDGPITFTDHANAAANIGITDSNGNAINPADLKADGQPVHYALLDAVTLVGYTGASAPTSIDGANVVFSVVLSSSGTGAYDFVLKGNLDHPITGTEDDLNLTFNYTAKDFDGDTRGSSFTVLVDDDSPAATSTVLSATVYEDEIGPGPYGTDRNGDGNGNDAKFIGNVSSLVNFGADHPGTFIVETTNLSPALLALTSGGHPLQYSIGADNTLVATDGNNTIFTFQVDPHTGQYTFLLTGPLDRPIDPNSAVEIHGHSVPLAAIDAVGSIYAVAEISGNGLAFEGRLPDGDVIIKVTNDGNTAVNWTLDNTSGGTDYPLSIAAHTSIFINVGPMLTPANSHFEVTGTGAPHGQTTVNPGHGTFEVTGGEGGLSLDMSTAITATDGDGDALPLHDQLIINVDDATPFTTGTPVVGQVSEVNLPFVSTDPQSLKINYGADGQGGPLTFATDNGGNPLHPAGLTSDGVPLSYAIEILPSGEQQLVAYKSTETINEPVFIATLNSPVNPTYIFSLFQNVDHPAGSGPLEVSFTVNATDADGSTIQQTFAVDIADSVPTIGTSATGNVSEDGPQPISGAPLAINWGQDDANVPGADRSLAFTNGVVTAKDPAGNAVALTSSGHAVNIVFIGGILVGFTGASVPASTADSQVVFFASLSDTTNSYDFTLKQPLDHPAPDQVNHTDYLDLGFNITATDSDHDTATGTFTVRVDAAGTIGSIKYDNETTGVFVNLDSHDHTFNNQTVAAGRSTDITGQGPVIGIDNVAGILEAHGGSGDDVLVGSSSTDYTAKNTLVGGAGQDLLVVVPDIIVPQGFDTGLRTFDHGDGTTEQVSIVGLAGEGDALHGGVGYDTVRFDLDGSSATGFVFDRASFPGSLELDGVEQFIGTDGNDVLMLPTDYTTDGSGVTVNGGKGDDVISGSNNAEALFGGEGNDKISGLGGNDTIHGNSGDDTIWGGDGADTIYGDFGDDTIYGGAGDDTLSGDNGNDAFIYKVGDGHDTVDGGAGTSDRLNVNGNNGDQSFVLTSTVTGFTVETDGDSTPEITATNVEKANLAVAGGHDAITIVDRSSDTVTLSGTTGDVNVTGANLPAMRILNTDTLDLTIVGGTGGDTIDASAVTVGAATVNLTLNGGSGNDTLIGSAGGDTLIGGADSDTITGGHGDDVIQAGSGNDRILYTVGDGNDRVDGGSDTGGPGPDYDILQIVGDATARTFTVGKISGGAEIDPHALDASAVDATDLFVTYNGPGAGSVRADEVERVKFVLNAGDTIVFGDTTGTGLASNTILVTSGGGDNTYDFRGYAGISTVVLNDTDGVGAGDTDLVQLAGKWTDWTITNDGTYYVLSKDGITIQAQNIESFFFQGDNGGTGATIAASQLIEQPPVIDDSTFTIAENSAAGTVVGSAGGSDGNGSIDPVAYSFVGGTGTGQTTSADGKFVIDATTGQITVASGAVLDYEATHALTEAVRLTDSRGQSDDAQVSINLTNVNEAPTNSAVTLASIAEDSGARLITQTELLSNASDVDSSLTATNLQIASGAGSLVDNQDGTWTYTPAANDSSAVSFSYTVTDGSLTAAGSATLDITPVNDAPVVSAPAAVTTAEDTSITFSGANAITVSDVDAGANNIHVTVTVHGGTLYLPHGPSGFQTIADGGNLPTFVQQSVINQWLQDAVFTPNPDSNGPASIDVAVNDAGNTGSGGALTANYTIPITITPVDDAPTTSTVALASIAEDSGARLITQAELLANAADVDGPSLRAIGLHIAAGSGTLVDNGNDTWTYTPAANDSTGVSFSYTVTDGTLTAAGSATLDITPVNDAPVVSAPAGVTTAEDTAITFSGANAITVSDVDAGTNNIHVTVTVHGGTLYLPHGPSGFQTIADGGNLPTFVQQSVINQWLQDAVFTPNPDFNGPASINVAVDDGGNTGSGGALTANYTIPITVTPVDDAPVVTISASGFNGDDFQGGYFGASSSPANLWTDSWTEAGDDGAQNGGDIRVVTAYGGENYLQLRDLGDNQDASLSRTMNLSGATSATLSFDYQRLGLEGADDTALVQISTDGVNFTTIATIGGGVANDAGFTNTSIDISSYISATTTVRFVATGGLDYLDGSPYDSSVDLINIDNVNVSYAKSADVSYTENGSKLTVIPASSLAITDVDDSNMESGTFVLTNKQAGDRLWIGSTQLVNGASGNISGVHYVVSEADGALTVSFSGSHSKSSYQSAISSIKFDSSSENPSTTDRVIQVSVNDGELNSNTVTTKIHVTAVNDAPTLSLDNTTTSLAENTSTATHIKVADIGITDDGQGTNNLSLSGADADSFEIVGNALYLKAGVALDYETKTSYGVTVAVDDPAVGNTPDASKTFTLNVTNVNEAPVITSGATGGEAENSPIANVVYQAQASDVDAGTTLTYSLSAGGDNDLFDIDSATGKVTFKASPNFETPADAGGDNVYDITVHANDGALDAAKAVQITVTDVAESPVVQGETLSVTDTSARDASFPVNGPTSLLAHATDPNGKTMTVTAISADGVNFTPLVNGAATVHGAHGDLQVVTSSGFYFFLPNSGTDALTDGATAQDVFTYRVTNSDGLSTDAAFTVNLTGADDAPIANGDTGAVVEDGSLSVTAANGVIRGSTGGSVADTDADNAASSLVVSGVVAGTGAVVQGVGVGTSIAGTWGHLTLNSDGSYTYLADNADGLAGGVTGYDRFSYTDTDPSGLISNKVTLTIALTGTDDPGVISGATTGTIREAGGQNNSQTDQVYGAARGDLSFLDIDGVDGWQPSSGNTASGYGWFSINAAGHWEYGLYNNNPTVEALKEDQHLADSFSVVAADGTVQVITIDILGNNDYPTAVGTLENQSVTDGHAFTYTIPANTFADVDGRLDGTGNPLTLSATLSDYHDLPAWLHFNASTGEFSGTPPDSFDGVINVRVQAYDGEGSTYADFALTVTKENDGAATVTITDTTQSATAPKVGDVLQASTTADPDGGPSSVVYHWLRDGTDTNATGTTYTLGANDLGHSISAKAFYVDGQGYAETPTSAATAPVISSNAAPAFTTSDVAGTVTEDAGTTQGANLVQNGDFDDYDYPAAFAAGWTPSDSGGFWAVSLYANRAGLTFTSLGMIEYGGSHSFSQSGIATSPSTSYLLDFWVRENSATETLYAQWNGIAIAAAADASGGWKEYKVVVTGTGSDTLTFLANDPNYNGMWLDDVSVMKFTPNSTQSTSGVLHFTDEAADTHTASFTQGSTVNSAGSAYIGTFSLDASVTETSGTDSIGWHFSADNSALQFLAAGQTITQTYEVAVADNHGGSSTKEVTVTLTGVNDAPVFGLGSTAGVVAKSTLPTGNLLTNGGFDTGNTSGWTVVKDANTYAQADSTFHFANGNTWNFEVYGTSAANEGIATISQSISTVAGQHYLLAFDYAGAYGLNPASTLKVSWAGSEIISLSGIQNTNTDSGVGSPYTYLVTGDGNSDALSFAIDAKGQNIRIDSVSLVRAEVAQGSVAFSDVDLTDNAHTVSVANKTANNYGYMTASVDEATDSVNWTFVVKDADISGLAVGQSVNQTYTLTLDDHHGGVVTKDVTVTINGLPSAPVITGISPDSDSGTVGDNITNDQTPTFVGTAQAFSTVTVKDGSTVLGTTTADANGAWTFTPDAGHALSSSTHSNITATATDIAGHVSAPSSSYALTIDATAPSTLSGVTLDLATASDSGASSTDNITNVTTPTITLGHLNGGGVTMSVGDVIQIIDTNHGNAVVGSYTVQAGDLNGSSQWNSGGGNKDIVLTTLGEGAHNLTVQLVDKAGNVGGQGGTLTVTEDTTAPSAPTGLDLAAADDTGSSNSDNITKNTTGLTISGLGEAGATVTLFDDVNNNGVKDNGETALGTVTLSGTTFTKDISLSAGVHHVGAFQTDVAGNVSAGASRLDITVDTTAPSITFTKADDSQNLLSGTVSDGGSGVASVVATRNSGAVNLGSDTSFPGDAWSISSGNFSKNQVITATATDVAGNTATVTKTAVDPIVLDLDHNGLGFTSMRDVVRFDITGDGDKDQVAWVKPGDGLLAMDLNHNGKIDDGSELFSANFAHGTFASGSAALASLDTNHDGVIDANDVDFSKLLVWQDANADGVTDAGELGTLADHGITSISAPGTPADDVIDGQAVTATGTFTLTDGTTGSYVEAALDTSFSSPAPLLDDATSLDWDNVVVGTPDAIDTLQGSAGTDKFTLTDLHAVDFIADYNFEQGDAVDLSAILGHDAGATRENAADYVQYDSSTGHLSVDTDGAANGANFVDVAVLNTPVADVKVILDDGVDVTINHLG